MPITFSNHPYNFTITEDDKGNKVGANEHLTVTVMHDGKTSLCNRRAFSLAKTNLRTMLMAELDGVRVYVKNNRDIIITKEDLKH